MNEISYDDCLKYVMPIKANEIREGNLVYEFGKVHTISFKNDDHWHLENFQPIPLTPEILKSAGFKRNGNTKNWFHLKIDNQTRFTGCDNGDETWVGLSVNSYWGGKSAIYLHQLQNLYFALTGNELEINL